MVEGDGDGLNFEGSICQVGSVDGGESDAMVDEEGEASAAVRGGAVVAEEGEIREMDISGGWLEFSLLYGGHKYLVGPQEVG